MDNFNNLLGKSEELTALVVSHGLSLIGAVLILIIGYTIAGWASKRIRNSAIKSEKFDNTLAPVFGQTVKVVILIITILAVLGQFGVETASIIAILGAAGLAVGLALQGTLSNVAAGMMLLILRPFKIGDVIEVSGTLGIVDEIGLFTTEMHSFDNIGIVMPNARVWGAEIKNLTQFETRRCDLEFGISYSDDMDKAIGLIKDVLGADDRVLDEPEALIAIGSLSDSSVVIRVRPWTATANLWPLRYDLIKRVKEVFEENDIIIPFPQRDVHMIEKN